jgi:3-oxoacyl-[acyl-carrier protein] reductase
MNFGLEDRVVVVTGGAKGIGRGAALAYGQEGAKVAVLDRTAEGAEATAAAIRDAGGTATAYAVDVTDEASVVATFARIVEELGTPWALLNSAGIGRAVPFLELDLASWREMLAVNLDGTFLCAREAARAMVAAKAGGRIINIGSQIGLKGGFHQTHYGASKAGVHGFSRSAARELAEHGINVISVAPGPIETDMLMSHTDEWLSWKKAELPLGRFGQVDEVVPMLVLLAGPVSANNITGAVMNVSGGDVMAD